jgi:uncharacterized protein (TIGR03067 family)
MKRLILSVFGLVVLGFLSEAVPQTGIAPGDAAERKKLQGVWRGWVVDGKGENPDRGPLNLEVTITADKISARNLQDKGKNMGEGTYRLDPTKRIKEIDATGVVLPAVRAKTYAGIYQIDGDTLRWCVDNQGKTRPTEFASRKGQFLLVLKRQGK